MKAIDEIQESTVLNLEGKTITLGALWRERTIVLVFVRHYG